MRLWHTTVRGNLASISRQGILAGKSRGKMRAVWLHAKEQQTWAFLHVVRRHGGDVRDVVSIEVDVPDEQVKRSSAAGLYYVLADVPPENHLGVIGFQVVSESPLSGRKGVKHA